jgi:hypothetical protein
MPTSTYRCLACGGRGEPCCPTSLFEATSPPSSGVCTAGLTCTFSVSSYRCN